MVTATTGPYRPWGCRDRRRQRGPGCLVPLDRLGSSGLLDRCVQLPDFDVNLFTEALRKSPRLARGVGVATSLTPRTSHRSRGESRCTNHRTDPRDSIVDENRKSSTLRAAARRRTRRRSTPAKDFLGAQFDLGLALGALPRGPRRARAQPAAAAGRQRARSPRSARPIGLARNPIGHGMGAPTVVDPRHRRAEGTATCARCSPARRSGARCSASRAPAPTWRRSRPRPCATATSGSSTARRCGRRLAHLAALGDAHRPHRPRRAQAPGPDLLRRRHARARASRCGRCAR